MYEILEKHYRDNYTSFLKISIARMGDVVVAEEIVQEAYCKACAYLSQGKEPQHLHAWFFRLLMNCINDAMETERMRGMSGQKNRSYRSDIMYNGLDISDNSDTIPHFVKDDISLELWSKVNKLPEKYKIIFDLYYIEGFSHKEIGSILNIHPKTSRNLAYSLRKYFT